MDLGLRGRVYLVTGGSRGLGFAAAQALSGEGARVVLSTPHEATAAAATARLTQNGAAADAVTWVVADNADPATPDLLIATAQDRFGRLDGALISAGGSPPGTVATTAEDAGRSAFESVFLGGVRLARALAADLDGRAAPGSLAGTGGSVVFVLASSVRVPLSELAISNGLFPGLAGVVKTLADELGPAGIRMKRHPAGPDCHRPGPRNSMPSAAIPMRCVRAYRNVSRCAGTASPRSSAGLPRSCSLPPRTPALGCHRGTHGRRHPRGRERNDRRGLVVAPG